MNGSTFYFLHAKLQPLFYAIYLKTCNWFYERTIFVLKLKTSMKKLLFAIAFLLAFVTGFSKEIPDEGVEIVDNSVVIDRVTNSDIEVTLPSMIFTFKDVVVKLKFVNPNHTKLLLNKGKINFIINGEDKELEFVNGEASFIQKFDTRKTLSIFTEDFSYNTTVTAYPLWAFFVPLGFIVLWIIKRMMKK